VIEAYRRAREHSEVFGGSPELASGAAATAAGADGHTLADVTEVRLGALFTARPMCDDFARGLRSW
jgi:hypothetical protein